MALIPPRITPPWEKPGQPSQPIEPPAPERRDHETRFKPGQSGNPRGRAMGCISKQNRIATEFEKKGSEVAAVVLAKALEGDLTAASLVLSRLSPPLRPAARCVQFELNTDAPIADQAKQVVQAVANGELDPDTAKQVMDMLSAYVGLKDVETFLAELKRLRESKGSRIPGGVLES